MRHFVTVLHPRHRVEQKSPGTDGDPTFRLQRHCSTKMLGVKSVHGTPVQSTAVAPLILPRKTHLKKWLQFKSQSLLGSSRHIAWKIVTDVSERPSNLKFRVKQSKKTFSSHAFHEQIR